MSNSEVSHQQTLAYLQKILTARVYDVAIESDLDYAPKLSLRTKNRIWLKREDTQPVFSFKLRGAYNKMVHLTDEQLSRGVICASAGNHAQGVALSAQRLNSRAVVVMPVTTPRLKSDAVKSFGGEVILHGESYTDAYDYAQKLADREQLTFVHPFDDPHVIAGQGTIGMELLRQHPDPIHAIFVAIGGGGLISGVAAYVKAIRPEVKIIGVQMKDSDAMIRSVQSGHRVTLKDVGLFSDGTAVRLVGEETFRITQSLVDGFVTVDTDAVCAAIKDVFEENRTILEPAGAMGVAAIKQYCQTHQIESESLIAITCGANMNFDRLRFVAERADVGAAKEALFAVTIPEERGSFRRLCELIGQRSVTEFSYRISDGQDAQVLVGIATTDRSEAKEIHRLFNQQGFDCLDLNEDDLTKEHIRYMVGGRSRHSQQEHLIRLQFPERPGALMRFLNSMPYQWNISLFHYRNQGADYGKILIGLQMPSSEENELKVFLNSLGFPYTNESSNPVYERFLN